MVTRSDLRERARGAVKGLRKRVAPREGEVSDEAFRAHQERAGRLQALLVVAPPVEDATLEPADVDRMNEFVEPPRRHGRMLDYALDNDSPPSGSLEAMAAGTGGGEASMEEFVAVDLDLEDTGGSPPDGDDPLEFDTGGLL